MINNTKQVYKNNVNGKLYYNHEKKIFFIQN